MIGENAVEKRGKPPLRVISMAWGEKFVDEFLELCLPALLAPGNLPLIAEHFSTELVFVTETRLFDRIAENKAIKHTAGICSVRLVALDDLIANPDSYGMSITYALYRGFEDLGPAMTECYMLFLNSDFILADNSYKGLLPHLLNGERLVLAPSYCANAEDVMPEILGAKDSRSDVMAIQPRCLADIILRHRHLTIRTKTINQRIYSLGQIDQFYMAVNETTLLGYQFPIAVVAMKPERRPPEINSHWDYSLITEFCPSLKFSVIADSDEFLMLELRERNRASTDVVLGWPTPQQIAGPLRAIATYYSATVGRTELLLHSDEIPAEIPRFSAALKEFVDNVMADVLPLPQTASHSQWEYHFPRFTQARKAYLTREKLAGRVPSARVIEFKNIPGEEDGLANSQWLDDGRAACESKLDGDQLAAIFLAYVSDADAGKMRTSMVKSLGNLLGQWRGYKRSLIDFDQQISAAIEVASVRAAAGFEPTSSPRDEATFNYGSESNAPISRMRHSIFELRQCASGIGTALTKILDSEVSSGLERVRALRATIDKQRIKITSEAVAWRPEYGIDPALNLPPSGAARKMWHFLFGAAPDYRRWHWWYSTISPTRKMVQKLAHGATQALSVRGPHAIGLLTSVDTAVTSVSLSAITQDFECGLSELTLRQFDMCVVEADFSDIQDFRAIYEGLRPMVKPGGTIVGFFLNFRGEALPLEKHKFSFGFLPVGGPMNIAYAGGWFSMAAVRLRIAVERALKWLRVFPTSLCAASGVMAAAPFACLGTLLEIRMNELDRALPKNNSTSITLVIDVG